MIKSKTSKFLKRKEVFDVVHDKIIFIEDLNFQHSQEARIIFSNDKIYVILFKKLKFDEIKWLNFYISIYSNFNYGENFNFSFRLTKENCFFHRKVFSEYEIFNFKSDTLIKLTNELGDINEKC